MARTSTLIAAIVGLAAAPAQATPSQRPAPPRDREAPPALQLPSDVRPLRYALRMSIDPARSDGFQGEGTIDVELARPRRAIWMHGRDLRLSRSEVETAGGERLLATWRQVGPYGLARLDLPRSVGPGRVRLHLAWRGPWGPLVGLYVSTAGSDRYAATQLQAFEARRAFPGFDDPGWKTPFDVTLVVPDGAVAIANTPELEAATGDGRREIRFATTHPLPTYLLFWGVGPFSALVPPPLPPNEIRETPLSIRGFAPAGRAGDLRTGLSLTAEVVPELERWFGTAFPYEKLDQIALPDYAYGAMENPGAVAYGPRFFLVRPETVTVDQLRLVAETIAHELSHHWFGDLVTLRWWTDAWLNESFATWMAYRVVDRLRPDFGVAARVMNQVEASMRLDALASTRAIRQPLRSMAEVWAQFDPLSYEKGAAILSMFERFAGEERFRDGVREYLAARPHGIGSTPELLDALSRAAGRDLSRGFSTFLDQPGIPLVSASVRCDARGARVLLAQAPFTLRGREAPARRWELPVCVRYEARGAIHARCALLSGASAELLLPEGCPAWLLPNADGAGYHRWALPPDGLAALAGAIPALTSAERVSLAGNLLAVQRAGLVTYGAAMDLLATLARDPDGDVAIAAIEAFSHARADLVPDAVRPAVEAVARALYRPALERLGWTARPGEPGSDRRLRAKVVELLVRTGRDPEVRREAARRGAAYAGLGGDSTIHAGAVEPELAPAALDAAVLEGGRATFDALLSLLATLEDDLVRVHVCRALGGADDPALSRRVVGLTADPRLKQQERGVPLARAGQLPESRGAMLAAVRRDPDAIASRLPPSWAAYAPVAFESLCDLRSAASVEALFRRARPAPEVERVLAQTLEQIRACAAERAADGAAAARWFEARARAVAEGGAR